MSKSQESDIIQLFNNIFQKIEEKNKEEGKKSAEEKKMFLLYKVKPE